MVMFWIKIIKNYKQKKKFTVVIILDGLHMDDAHGGGSCEEGYGYTNAKSHGLDGIY